MVDREFWGSPLAWKVIGIGILFMVLGLAAQLLGAGLCLMFGLVLIGAVLAGGAVGYLLWWENWSLLKEKEEREEVPSPQEEDLKDWTR